MLKYKHVLLWRLEQIWYSSIITVLKVHLYCFYDIADSLRETELYLQVLNNF